MQTITYEIALRALNEVVAAKGPDHVYESSSGTGCWNTNREGTEAECIVGHALVWLGVPVEFLGKEELRGCSIYSLRAPLAAADMLDIDQAAYELLTVAQASQDQHVNWGDSVVRAHLGEEWFSTLAPR